MPEQEHLSWGVVHVVGHSMGGMIALRLAAMAPERIASLNLISTTAGGLQSVPRSFRALKYALQVKLRIAISGFSNFDAFSRCITAMLWRCDQPWIAAEPAKPRD